MVTDDQLYDTGTILELLCAYRLDSQERLNLTRYSKCPEIVLLSYGFVISS
jgi:hypothetical protein